MNNVLLKVIRAFRARLFLLLDGILLLFLPFSKSSNRVLIIRLDAIGDFVLWLDAAKTLVSHYHDQGYSVVLLGNKAWAGWAREMGLADEVWEVDVIRFNKQITYRWQWLRVIRNAGFKIAIQPTYTRIFLAGDALMRASCACERIGSVGDESYVTPWLKSRCNRWFTRLIPATSMPLMELKRNSEFMRGLGFADFQARLLTIPEVPDARPNCLPKQPYAVFMTTASWEGREWPVDNFIEIGHRLEAFGMHVVVVGGLADYRRASVFIEKFSGKAVDLIGKTTLSELVETLRGAAVVVSNETSAVHIGAAVNVPVVCVLGGGHFGRFAPYDIEVVDENRNMPVMVVEEMACFGCNWQCIYSRKNTEAVKCIQDISVERIWSAVEMIVIKRNKLMVEELG